jgi:hypothetical protein
MPDRTVKDILLRLNQVLAEVVQLRGELAAYLSSAPAAEVSGQVHLPVDQVHLVSADDLAPEHLIDTTSASARFNYPRIGP